MSHGPCGRVCWAVLDLLLDLRRFGAPAGRQKCRGASAECVDVTRLELQRALVFRERLARLVQAQ